MLLGCNLNFYVLLLFLMWDIVIYDKEIIGVLNFFSYEYG